MQRDTHDAQDTDKQAMNGWHAVFAAVSPFCPHTLLSVRQMTQTPSQTLKPILKHAFSAKLHAQPFCGNMLPAAIITFCLLCSCAPILYAFHAPVSLIGTANGFVACNCSLFCSVSFCVQRKGRLQQVGTAGLLPCHRSHPVVSASRPSMRRMNACA